MNNRPDIRKLEQELDDIEKQLEEMKEKRAPILDQLDQINDVIDNLKYRRQVTEDTIDEYYEHQDARARANPDYTKAYVLENGTILFEDRMMGLIPTIVFYDTLKQQYPVNDVKYNECHVDVIFDFAITNDGKVQYNKRCFDRYFKNRKNCELLVVTTKAYNEVGPLILLNKNLDYVLALAPNIEEKEKTEAVE